MLKAVLPSPPAVPCHPPTSQVTIFDRAAVNRLLTVSPGFTDKSAKYSDEIVHFGAILLNYIDPLTV